MKNLILLIVLILFSCSKSEESSENEKNISIIGKWYYIADIVNDIRYPYIPGNHDGNEDCTIIDDYVEFDNNGNYNRYFFEYCTLQLNDDAGYTVDKNNIKLFLKSNNENFAEGKIKLLNEDKLTLEFNVDYDEDDIIDHVILEFER